MKIRLASSIQIDSIVDGPGVRAVIWTQGCPHKCPGCHNPITHSMKDGYLEDINNLKDELSNMEGQTGITFSGGDPMVQPEACLELAKHCKSLGLNIWCYTGYTYEQLLDMSVKNPNIKYLLDEIDVLVDGKFILEDKSLTLKYKGSKNQRIIDMPKTLKEKKICLHTIDLPDEIKSNDREFMYI